MARFRSSCAAGPEESFGRISGKKDNYIKKNRFSRQEKPAGAILFCTEFLLWKQYPLKFLEILYVQEKHSGTADPHIHRYGHVYVGMCIAGQSRRSIDQLFPGTGHLFND